jgi:hypothetical protein
MSMRFSILQNILELEGDIGEMGMQSNVADVGGDWL